MSIKAVAVLSGEVVKGVVHFEQAEATSPVRVFGQITGLNAGLHGFHVHEFGDTTNGILTTTTKNNIH
jgi:superoxide dismutase, Cu-Zn family